MTVPPPTLPDDTLAAFVASTDRTIVTIGDRFGLRAGRTYATDVDDLWSAWTSPDRMSRWLGTPYGDLREGSEVRLFMDGAQPRAEATTGFARVRVLHCDAPHRLVVRWAWEDEAPSLVDLTLRPLDGGRTALVLEHVVLDEGQATGYGAGWEDFLARLDAAVTGRDPGFESLEPALTNRWESSRAAQRPFAQPSVSSTVEGRALLKVDRWVAAPPDVVWAHLSSARALSGWYADAIEVAQAEVGGAFRCAFDQGAATGEIVSCQPERELAATWRWDGAATSSTMTLTLEGEDREGVRGTHVTWREDGATGNVTAYAAGLQAHLVGLDRAARGLTSRDSRWYADFALALSGLTGRYANPFED